MSAKIGSYHFNPYAFNQYKTAYKGRARTPSNASDLEQSNRFAQIKTILQTMQNWLTLPTQSAPLAPPLVSKVCLDNANPRKHLIHLSQISPDNALQSVATQKIITLLPKQNPIRLGYEDRVQYESVLGDYVIATQAALTALGILTTTFIKTFSCIVNQEESIEYAHAICTGKTATFWNEPSGKTILAISALLLATSSYLHTKGWLGALIHDPFLHRRSHQITTLFQRTAEELTNIQTTHPTAAKKIANRILTNAELIENTFLTELQLLPQIAKQTTDLLKIACKQVLLKNPTSPQEKSL